MKKGVLFPQFLLPGDYSIHHVFSLIHQESRTPQLADSKL